MFGILVERPKLTIPVPQAALAAGRGRHRQPLHGETLPEAQRPATQAAARAGAWAFALMKLHVTYFA